MVAAVDSCTHRGAFAASEEIRAAGLVTIRTVAKGHPTFAHTKAVLGAHNSSTFALFGCRVGVTATGAQSSKREAHREKNCNASFQDLSSHGQQAAASKRSRYMDEDTQTQSSCRHIFAHAPARDDGAAVL